jgi:uncharacterized membrane protein YebE (DUF533 family)
VFHIDIVEKIEQEGTEPRTRKVLAQELESIDLPAIIRAVNGFGNRKTRKTRASRPAAQ